MINDQELYNRTFLCDKYNQKILTNNNQALLDSSKNIVICTNSFIYNVNTEKSIHHLRALKFKQHILNEVNYLVDELSLSKDIIGAHLRGTDFNNPFSFYEEQLKPVVSSNPDVKILISSDDIVLEDYIANVFLANIIRRVDKIYVNKFGPSKASSNTRTSTGNNNDNNSLKSNTNITADALKDAVVDLLLLAKTDFKIFDPNSSFALTVNDLK